MSAVNVSDPFELFGAWWRDAQKLTVREPTAMALATVDDQGRPTVRMVLLKSFDRDGFVFYTNYQSRKGGQLLAHPQAGLCFYWDHLERQVRIEGGVQPVSAEESDAYFATRARDSQIGAWASDQSRPMSGPGELKKRVAQAVAGHAIGKVPRPPYWGGFRLVPERLEFWQGKLFRLHDRFEFTRQSDGTWRQQWLFP